MYNCTRAFENCPEYFILCFPYKRITFSSHEFNTHEYIKIIIRIRNDSTTVSSNLFIKYIEIRNVFVYALWCVYHIDCACVYIWTDLVNTNYILSYIIICVTSKLNMLSRLWKLSGNLHFTSANTFYHFILALLFMISHSYLLNE